MLKGLVKKTTLIAILLLSTMTGLAFFSLYHDSAIMDEIAHIPAGYSYLKFHDYRLNPEHPPLAKILAATPLLFQNLTFPTDLPAWKNEANGQWEVGWKFIYERGNDADLILLSSRIPMLILMIILGIYVYLWTKKLFGPRAALLSLFLFSFSPNIIAHSRFVTTDIAATLGIMMALYHFIDYLKNPSWKKMLFAGTALAIAGLLKYSCFVLYPMFLMLVFAAIILRKKEMPEKFFLSWLFKKQLLKRGFVYLGSFTLICLMSFVIIAIFYQGMMYKMPVEMQHLLIDTSLVQEEAAGTRNILHQMAGNILTQGFGQWLLGLFMVFTRVAGGNTTYFLGETSNQAWWYFYPVAIIIKTPLPTLILTLICGIFSVKVVYSFLFRLLGKTKQQTKKLNYLFFEIRKLVWSKITILSLLGVIIFFLGTGIVSNLNIGLRHVLPFYPFWFILLGGGTIFIFKKLKKQTKVIAFGFLSMLMIWYFVSNLITFPSYLAYFNETVGGSKNGYKYMVDSNVDWGQDLKRLAKFVEKNNIDQIKVDYFGGGAPNYYLGEKYQEWHASSGKTTGWIAVSATYYQNSKYYSRVLKENDYSWLENYQPVAIIGHSILVYNIEK